METAKWNSHTSNDRLGTCTGILNVVRCNCHVNSKNPCGGSRCSCHSNGLHCVAACGDCRGMECENCDNCETSIADTDQVENLDDDSYDNLFFV